MKPAMDDKLSVWAIYRDAKDYPGQHVARRHYANAHGHGPTEDVITGKSLEELRAHFRMFGFVQFARDAKDDPTIVETWL